MDDLVLPSLPDWQRWADAGVHPLDVLQPLQAQALALGLWKLFLPTLLKGRKWFITGAAHPLCRLALVLARCDGATEPHASHSIALVPLDAPGLPVERNIPVMDHQALEGHCEIVLRDVHVPADQLLGAPGSGFAMAQARLGPGRVHHTMRSIGPCELALELMCERALERRAFGVRIGDFANVQDWTAHSRLEIDQARLLVLRAAWKMDRLGNAAARVDAAALKLVKARHGSNAAHLRRRLPPAGCGR